MTFMVHRLLIWYKYSIQISLILVMSSCILCCCSWSTIHSCLHISFSNNQVNVNLRFQQSIRWVFHWQENNKHYSMSRVTGDRKQNMYNFYRCFLINKEKEIVYVSYEKIMLKDYYYYCWFIGLLINFCKINYVYLIVCNSG